MTDSTPVKDIQLAKKAYWKLYHQHYYQFRKKAHRRLTLRLTENEYQRLQHHAKAHSNLSFSAFLKQASLGYLEQQYIPREPQKIDALTKSIRKIGNIINQVVQSIHRTAKRGNLSGVFSDENDLKKLHREYEFLTKRVTDLEKEVQSFFTTPPKRVGETLLEILEREPSKIQQLQKLLEDMKP